MSARVQNHIAGRLSLRSPQAESLARLVRALDAAPELLGHERDVSSILSTLKAQFPTLEDFEREFPSLCFALATGVGKTRLMGAFIAYLHLAHGINNFFVLAPNLTIYNKLIADFTRNTPKYVFKGIAEFVQQPPLIITGDNYDQTGAAVDDRSMGFVHDVRINISKINSEVRGGKEPRIKRMLFGGFARCLYPLQKFDSDTERRFAIILERDASKWFKPAKGQFQIFYKLGTEQPEYIPDFVAETDSMIFMVETKARGDINTPEVQAKAAAAMQWCQHASNFTASVGGKPWKYLLVPHDEVNESRRLIDFLRFEIKA